MIKTFLGRSSYYLENDTVELYTSILGANTVAYFKIHDKKICPFFIAPWWKEPWQETGVNLLNVCRGSFFCLPFGGDASGFLGKPVPSHGLCANENWSLISIEDDNNCSTLKLKFLEGDGSIEKEIRLVQGQTVFYERNKITGYSGKYPVAFHPMIKLPDLPGKATLSIGTVIDCYTTPSPLEKPENRGYSLFKNNQQVKDFKKVPTVFNDTEDLSRQPTRKGFEDIILLLNDKSKKIGFSAITFIEEGYLYFQIKNSVKLGNTMLWISNGGRHYPPWNGRCSSVIGIEDSVSFFHYGAKNSVEKNFLSDMGYDTFVQFNKDSTYSYELISGVVEIPGGFNDVERIEPFDKGMLIVGKDNIKITVGIDLSFIE